MIDIQTVSISEFEDCLNQEFSIEVGDHHIELRLCDCKLSKFEAHDESDHARHPFALTFAGEGQPQLNQGTYILNNETLGRVTIFLVPIGTGKYEAIFN